MLLAVGPWRTHTSIQHFQNQAHQYSLTEPASLTEFPSSLLLLFLLPDRCIWLITEVRCFPNTHCSAHWPQLQSTCLTFTSCLGNNHLPVGFPASTLGLSPSLLYDAVGPMFQKRKLDPGVQTPLRCTSPASQGCIFTLALQAKDPLPFLQFPEVSFPLSITKPLHSLSLMPATLCLFAWLFSTSLQSQQEGHLVLNVYNNSSPSAHTNTPHGQRHLVICSSKVWHSFK